MNGIEKIGKRLRESRIESGLYQIHVAEACGVTRPAVHQWEDGHTQASIVHLAKAAELLGVSFEWLCLGTGPKKMPPP